MPGLVIDAGMTREQAAALASRAARSVAEGLPRGTLRASLTAADVEQLVVPLRLFAQERERALARRLNAAVAALFRVLWSSRGPLSARSIDAALLAFEQHGFSAAELGPALHRVLEGRDPGEGLARAQGASAVVRSLGSGMMPPSRLAMAVLLFAAEHPATGYSFGADGHLFDGYASVLMRFELEAARAQHAQALPRVALLDTLRRHVEKSAQERMRLAYERSVYEDENKLFGEILAPTVVKMALVILSVLPVTWMVRLGALVYQATLGLLQFLQTLSEVAEDGALTEEEKGALGWAALGIIPFRPLQLLVAGKALFDLGGVALELLVAGTQQLLEELPARRAAEEAGFHGLFTLDPDEALFIPEGFQ